ncbi:MULTISPECIES: MFS transporter [Pseudomonas]|uniref:MFS transporter n=1 Tax=Pseudomonas sp. MIL9 TaxID=2807620 RepID=UPI001CB9561A|nr:MFS transporter [Pseudomonas sp. MIL9]
MHNETTSSVLGDVVNNRQMGAKQYEVLALCLLVAILDGFDTQVVGFLVSPMAHSLEVAPATFGPVFASALFGLMVGALLLAPLADGVGRKKVLLASILTFGAFSLMTAAVGNFNELLLARFLTGLGLGGAIPNLVALTSEYMPRRFSRSAVTLVFCGMPLGAMLAGLTVQQVLVLWDWRAIFIIGGLLPLAVALIISIRLPESMEYLARSTKNRTALERIVRQLFPSVGPLPEEIITTHRDKSERTPVKRLFCDGMWRRTILLWLPYTMNLLILYSIMSWIPTVLATANAPLSAGIQAIILFSLGGVIGSICQGHVMNRYGATQVLVTEFCCYLALVLALSTLPLDMDIFLTVMFVLGIIVQGCQAGLNAVAAEIYPASIRSTGIGWALGVGRIGSILGPIFGGLILSLGWSLHQIFIAALLPGAVALGATLIILLDQVREAAQTNDRLLRSQ